jgi:small subunit ribosomal protein S1
LGIKQIHDDPWAHALDSVKSGAVFEDCVVTSVSDHGVFVSVSPGIDAFISNGDIPDGAQPGKGTKVKAEIANVDAMDRRISMSMRNVGETPAADQHRSLAREQSAAGQGGTLGELLKQKLGDQLTSMTQGASDAEVKAEPADTKTETES